MCYSRLVTPKIFFWRIQVLEADVYLPHSVLALARKPSAINDNVAE
jgi:hypothetical protein